MPKVSVIVPCYNHGSYLPDALASVQAQSYRDFEIIVVDDGSTDEATVRLLDRIKQPQLTVVRTPNRGVSAARNRGIELAQGTFILPLDADDVIGPEYLAQAVPILERRPEVGVVFCQGRYFGEKNGVQLLPPYDSRRLLVENLIYSAAFFRKADWALVGGYNEKMLSGWEDWDFWLALAQLQRKVVKLPEEMFLYRVRKSSRDHSLRVGQKLHMFSLMLWRHRGRYLRHGLYVLSRLLHYHLFARYRRAGGAS